MLRLEVPDLTLFVESGHGQLGKLEVIGWPSTEDGVRKLDDVVVAWRRWWRDYACNVAPVPPGDLRLNFRRRPSTRLEVVA